jgi:Zn-dependent peptidase ImmA (M78 family)/transcriptional regulator with XRE-family HTH domain
MLRIVGEKQLVKQSVPGFRPEKLAEARFARGLSQTTLAEMAGVSRQRISKYEGGNQAPTVGNFEALYKTLNVPPEYLLRERKRAIDQNSPIFYRRNVSAIQTQLLRAEAKFVWLQDTHEYLARFVEFPELNLPSMDFPSDPQKIEPEDIEAAAENVRSIWGMGDCPISNMNRLVENNGIVVGSYDLEAKELDAFSQFQFDQPNIVLGSDRESGCRIRFSIAHELGHMILHRNVPGFAQQSKEIFNLMEKQAHRFAGAFLFPYEAFLQEIIRPDLNVFRVLKPRWGMSIQAMIYRSSDLGMIDKDDVTRMHISMNRKGWKKRPEGGKYPAEVLDDQISIELPELITDAFKVIIEENIVSKAQAISDIGLNRADIEEVSGLSEGYLSDTIIELESRRRLREPSKSPVSKDKNGNIAVIPFPKQKSDEA